MTLKTEVIQLLKMMQDYIKDYIPNNFTYWQQIQHQTEHIKITNRLMHIINFIENAKSIPYEDMLTSNTEISDFEPILQFLLIQSLNLYIKCLKKCYKKPQSTFIGSTYSSN